MEFFDWKGDLKWSGDFYWMFSRESDLDWGVIARQGCFGVGFAAEGFVLSNDGGEAVGLLTEDDVFGADAEGERAICVGRDCISPFIG